MQPVIVFIILLSICWIAIPCSAVHRITVGPDNEDYDSLGSAIASLYTYSGIESEAIIAIFPNKDQNENIVPYLFTEPYSIQFGQMAFFKLIIEGANDAGNCILESTVPSLLYPGRGTVFQVYGSSSKDLTLKNLHMKTVANYHPIYRQDSTLHKLLIEGCDLSYPQFAISISTGYHDSDISIVNNNFSETDPIDDTLSGPGIYLFSSQGHMDLNISDNVIEDDILPLLVNSTEHTTLITNNTIVSNHPTQSDYSRIQIDDIFYNQNSSFSFSGNLLINTSLDTDRVSGEIKNNTFWASSAYCRDFIRSMNWTDDDVVTQILISNNMFYGSNTQECIIMDSTSNILGSVNLKIENNSFLNVSSAIETKLAESLPENPIHENEISSFKNNLIQCSSDPMILLTEGPYTPSTAVNIDHSMFVNGYPNNSTYFIVDSQSCPIGDPLITMEAEDRTYSLIWDETQKSPLINTGTPLPNLLSDPDGTPPDIGAVYYPHHSKTYDFSRPVIPGSRIFWMSFPVLDDRSFTNGQHWNELGHLFEHHMLNPPYGNQIESASWSYNSSIGSMTYGGGQWQFDEYVTSQPKGFKLKFNDNIGEISTVTVNGFKADYSSTPVSLLTELDSGGTPVPFENWIGYFVPYTQKAGDAFSRFLPGSTRETYLDHIYAIETQTWATKRIDKQYGSSWIIDPNRYTISEGDMLAIKLLPKAPEQMYWKGLSGSVPPRTKLSSEFFSYTEQLDYTPIFIEFDPADLPDEVGIYVAGECKGAAIVDSTLVEVNYYASEAKNGDELQIMFYHEGKGTKQASGMLVYNPDTMLFEAGKLGNSQLGDYGYISFNRGEGSSLVPLVTELKQNYPNPFRQETRISWVLEKDAPVSVDIYNLKGQKVRTLFSGLGKKGRQTSLWNGYDENNRKVASGVYFYRLNTPDGVQVHKMLVLK